MMMRASAASSARNASRKRRAALADWRWLLLLGGIGALTVFAGLGATGTPSTGTGASPAAGAGPAVAVDLAVEPVDVGGQAAYVLALGVMASGNEEAVLTFRTGQTYDFAAFQDGREVWRWSAGRAFHQAVTERRFRPGELVVFTHVWDGRDALGNPLTGPVEIRAWLSSDPPITAEPAILQLP